MTVKVEACRSCNAEIVWARTTNNRAMPVDNRPVPGGNIELEYPPAGGAVAHYVKPEPGVVRFRSHFASCPDAWRWKRR